MNGEQIRFALSVAGIIVGIWLFAMWLCVMVGGNSPKLHDVNYIDAQILLTNALLAAILVRLLTWTP